MAQHVDQYTPQVVKGLGVAPRMYFGKIEVSDTSGTIDTSASLYPPQATYTRNSAGQYTLVLPGLANAIVVPALLSAGGDQGVYVESNSLSDQTLTVVLQVYNLATPAAADLAAATDAIYFVVFGYQDEV